MEVTPTPVLIEVLGVIPGLSYFSNFYHRIIGTAGEFSQTYFVMHKKCVAFPNFKCELLKMCTHADPRANSYPNMKSPDPSAALVLGYLIVSLSLGPRLMANRRAPSMTKGLLFLYNFTAININGFLAVAVSLPSLKIYEIVGVVRKIIMISKLQLTMEVIKADYKELCQSVEQTEKPTWVSEFQAHK